MRRVSLAAATVCAAALLSPLSAGATLFRAYLSGAAQPGADCSLAHPCRYLPDALAAVNPGGEIWILDSANFNQGTVNITKSVTILAVPGEVGSIQSIGGAPAISISTDGVDVTLRNLVIAKNAVSPGTKGISMVAGHSLTIEDSVIAQTPDTSVYAVGAVRVQLKNTTILNSEDYAVFADDGAVVDVSGCSILANHGGIWARTLTAGRTTLIEVSDTTISNASAYAGGPAVYAYTNGPGMVASIYITRSTVRQAFWGLMTRGTGTSTLEVSGSTIVDNFYNLSIDGGMVRSLQNNHVSGGIAADAGSLTPIAPR